MTNKKEHQKELQQAAEILAAVINGKFSDRDLWSAAEVFDAERSASCGWGETPHIIWNSGPFDWAIAAGAGWGDWAWLDEAIDALGAYVEPYNGSVLGVWEIGPALVWDDGKRSKAAASVQTLEARLLAREFEIEFANEIGGGALELDDGVDQQDLAALSAAEANDDISIEADEFWQEVAAEDLAPDPGAANGTRAIELLKMLDAAEASNEVEIVYIMAFRGTWTIDWYPTTKRGSRLKSTGSTFYAALEDFDQHLQSRGITKFTFGGSK